MTRYLQPSRLASRFFQIGSVCGLAMICLSLSGCSVDLSAVNDFAKESSAISSNKAMLDDTDAQNELRDYDIEIGTRQPVADPNSQAFRDHLAVTNSAIEALNGYMTVLAQLSAKDVANVSSDFSTMGTALKSLKVTDPAAQAALNATSALTNILLDAAVRNNLKKLVVSAATPVNVITTYLSDQAQTTSNTYNQAISANNKYWDDLTKQSHADIQFCGKYTICKPVNVLAERTRETENANLSVKAAQADAAVTAFKKIQKDNAALVQNVDSLDSAALIEVLKVDEPDLLTAIKNLKSI